MKKQQNNTETQSMLSSRGAKTQKHEVPGLEKALSLKKRAYSGENAL